jgi:hypothetical protein
MSDDRALLIAIPERHLESVSALVDGPVVLPAGGVGDLDTASAGMPVLVMATDAADGDVPAVTWRATFLARVPYEPGAPWPEGLPAPWVEEHPPLDGDDEPVLADDEDDEDEDEDDDEDEDVGSQTFLAVDGLERLPRDSWLFTNELVRKQARRGRSFRPRIPTMVDVPD